MSDKKITVEEIMKNNDQTKEEVKKKNNKLEEELKSKLDTNLLNKLKEKQKEKQENKELDVSMRFGFVGLGQAGGRICEIFNDYGYDTIIFNTSKQDLEPVNISENKKVFLPLALGGAGKDLNNGRIAVENNADLILEKLKETFKDNDMLFLIISGGGGTGSGGAQALIPLLSSLGMPIGVFYILPMDTDDSLSNNNALLTLSNISKMATSDIISPLILIDNAKIELIFPNLPKSQFWGVANKSICEPLHLFNYYSKKPSNFETLDPMDFARLVSQNDISTFGYMEVDPELAISDTTAIAESVINNLESGLLASDFNLKETKYCGYILVANLEILNRLPAINIEYCKHIISEICDSPNLIHGVYVDENVENVKIYSIFCGLGLPNSRINSLKTKAEEQMKILKEKEKYRAKNMTVDYGNNNEVKNKIDDIHKQIAQKKSSFGKITNNRIIDRRKR